MRLTGCYLDVLTPEEVGRIHAGALRILEEMGMEIQHTALLELMGDNGLVVDLEAQRVRFPKAQVEAFLVEAEKNAESQGTPQVSVSAGIYLSQYHDPVTDELVPWTEERLAGYMALARSLPYVGAASMLGCRLAIPAELEPLYERFYNWKYGAIEGGSIHLDELCPYLFELYQVRSSQVGKSIQEIFHGTVYLVPPLRLGRHEAYQVHYFWERGLRVGIGDMFALGSSAPVTLAGAVTLNLAEQIALRMLEWALYGRKRLHIGGSIAVLDMRTTFYRAAPPERSLCHLMTAQMARYYGASFGGHAMLTDAKRPSFEAGVQKALNGLLLLLAGGHIWYPAGLLSADEICSPVQMILDHELLGILNHFQQEFLVTEESLGLEAILEAGPGGHFLDKDHTRQHFRSQVWQPSLFSRQMLRAWIEAGGKSDLEKARQQVLDFMSRRKDDPVFLTEEWQKELLAVITRAEQELA